MFSSPTRLCLIRHGETDWNAGKRVQGQIDIPLSALGHAQARATGNTLMNEGFAAIYSSDLIRARQTAEATAHLVHLPIQFEPGLRERHFGVFQGLTYEEAEARYPEDYRRHKARDSRFAPPGGESLVELAGRIEETCNTIIRRHPGEAVLLFTHGGVLDIMHRQAAGKPLDTPRDFTIPNCAISWIEVVRGCWTLLSWAERSHLDPALDEL